MSLKTLISLLVALAVLGGAAYVMNKKPAARVTVGGVTGGDKAFPELNVNAINSVELVSMSETIRLARASAGWVVESMHNYPAQFSSIAGFLRKLNDLNVSLVMREGEATLEELGLDTATFSPDRLDVALSYEGGKSPVRFTLGANKAPKESAGMGMGGFAQSRFMRIDNGPSLQVDETFTELGRRPEDWIDRQLFQVNANDITKVDVKREGEEYTLARGENGVYSLTGLSEDQTVDADAAQRLFQSLQWLQFDAVVDPAQSDESVGLAAFDSASFTSTNGIVRTLEVTRTEDAGRKAMRVKFSDSSEGGVNAAEVAKLNEQHGAWRYRLPSGTLNPLVSARDTLIAKPSEAASDAAPTESTGDAIPELSIEPPMPVESAPAE